MALQHHTWTRKCTYCKATRFSLTQYLLHHLTQKGCICKLTRLLYRSWMFHIHWTNKPHLDERKTHIIQPSQRNVFPLEQTAWSAAIIIIIPVCMCSINTMLSSNLAAISSFIHYKFKILGLFILFAIQIKARARTILATWKQVLILPNGEINSQR